MSATDVIDSLRPDAHGPPSTLGSAHRVGDGAGVATNGHLSRRVSFALLVSIAVTFLAASSAPTPLYAIYEANWHFSPITLTVVFAVYAVAVLAALLTVGSLSDHIGRQPVLLAAILLQVAALSVFADGERCPGPFCGTHHPGCRDWRSLRSRRCRAPRPRQGQGHHRERSGNRLGNGRRRTRLRPDGPVLAGADTLDLRGVAGDVGTRGSRGRPDGRTVDQEVRGSGFTEAAPRMASSSPSTIADRNPDPGGHLGPGRPVCLTRTNHGALPDRIGLRGAGRALIVRARSERCGDGLLCEQGVAAEGLVPLHRRADRRRRSHGPRHCQHVDHRLLLGNGTRRNRVWLRVPGRRCDQCSPW